MAASTNGDNGDEELNIREFILDHLADDYEWQIVSDGNRHLTISLPVILYSKNADGTCFLHHNCVMKLGIEGFKLLHKGKYKVKIVKQMWLVTFNDHWISLTKRRSSHDRFAYSYPDHHGVSRSYKRKPLEGKKGSWA